MRLELPEVDDRPLVFDSLPVEPEVLIEEARRHQRRRHARIIGVVLAAVVIGGLLVLLLITTMPQPSRMARPSGRAAPASGGQDVHLRVAGPLAVATDGDLYVADIEADRVLLRLRDGRFRVVAGDGKAGFSGDGSPATRARLSDISGLAVAPNGDLYIADGGRVQVVNQHGVIHTVAGDGRGNPGIHLVASGTVATAAELGSRLAVRQNPEMLSIAFGPGGHLYISTPTQILRLTSSHRLDVVHVHLVAAGPAKRQRLGGELAVDKRGDIYVGTTTGGWSIWRIGTNGAAHKIGVSRGSGGMNSPLQEGPNGVVYAQDGAGIARIQGSKLIPAYKFAARLHSQYFPPMYFAFTKTGTIYADDLTDTYGFEQHQQLVRLQHGRETLLWQASNKSR